MATVALSLQGVSYTARRTAILSGISLQVLEGEIFCLLGPSGCGKTTLLRVVSGLLTPTAGRVEICRKAQHRVPPHKRGVGFVFQDPGALFPHLTVFENVAFALRVRKRPRHDIRSRVHNILDAVHLLHKSHDFPAALSGGEKQRVALARAFVYEPVLLLLDEPFTGLDNITKNELTRYLLALRSRFNTACVYVTHDEREALRVADRLAVLAGGTLLQSGLPNEIVDNPLSATVARVTGEWNLLRVERAAEGDRLALPAGSEPTAIAPPHADLATESCSLAFRVRDTVLRLQRMEGGAQVQIPGVVTSVFTKDGGLMAAIDVKADHLLARLSAELVVHPLQEVYVSVPIESIRAF